MSVFVNYLDVWKWLNYDWTTYTLYGKMFDPNINIPSTSRSSFNVVNAFSSIDLSGFQPWLEVCVSWTIIENNWGSDVSVTIKYGFQQRKDNSRYTSITPYTYIQTIEAGLEYAYRTWVWIDPDEIRPWITDYRFYVQIDNWTPVTKTFTVSWLSFDSTPHPAGYLWVEWGNLCYIPPSIYSGSSNTWYKHMIQPDPWYSWSSWESPWHIWIPSGSSDHHIYYVNEYGIVSRTKESYDWSGWSSNVWSSKKWYIRLTPSTSSRPERQWYNYLCYIDGGWYKRRMWVWEI